MKKQTRKEKAYKVVALGLAFTMLGEMIAPTAAYALTGGPSQPEFESFEPAGTSEMVNLFTGDFNYNIPLMTVPGPNGGYPINLAYHAGISMEQEASWVGLGWNINAGEISRGMRGLPDDFNGDEIVEEFSMKPSVSVNVNLSNSVKSPEIFGLKIKNVISGGYGLQLYTNNYSGVGYRISGFAAVQGKENKRGNAHGLSIQGQLGGDGVGVNAGYSYWNKNKGDKNNGALFKASSGWSSRQGLGDIEVSFTPATKVNGANYGAGASFSSSSYVPNAGPQMAGLMGGVGIAFGNKAHLPSFMTDSTISVALNVGFNVAWPKDENRIVNGYGYMHTEDGDDYEKENFALDFNREKDVTVNKHSEVLAVPVSTQDIYQVKGHGVGGVFRPFRSDVGIYSDAQVTSNIWGGQLVPEIGNSVDKYHIGGDFAFMQSQSQSGIWFKDGIANNNNTDYAQISDLQFYKKSEASAHALYEPFYFKMMGEMTASPENELYHLWDDEPALFRLAKTMEQNNDGFAIRPTLEGHKYAKSRYDTEPYKDITPYKYRTSRQKRVEGISNKTAYQMYEYYLGSVPENLYAINEGVGPSASPSKYGYTTGKSHHIAQIEMQNPDGNRYVYGLPVYNTSSKSAFFSVDAPPSDPNFESKITNPYQSVEASRSNRSGNDHLYKSTQLPGYVTNYLLTEIISADYVDITGDGPSDDDLGYWVKFNYSKDNNNYNWRMPYRDAYNNLGSYDNDKDNKGSYEYGTREMYYLHSIETKTHIAQFKLSTRDDGRGANQEENLSTSIQYGTQLYKLDEIVLYSKIDPAYGTISAVPLKTVQFTYNNSLCPSVPNNPTSGGGKLTLLSVKFKYLGNTKGELSPYEFSYTDGVGSYENPTYVQEGNDRWGGFKRWTGSTKFINHETPYVDQSSKALQDEFAEAWNLKKIKLPSGAEINVSYESDDYKFVQDKKAMQLCQVVGFYDATNGSPSSLGDLSEKLTFTANKENTKVYFKLETPIAVSSMSSADMRAEVKKYIAGIDKLYFKVFAEMKKQYGGNDMAWDYVEGYCDIDQGTNSYDVGPAVSGYYTTGYFKVTPVPQSDFDDLVIGSNDMHPFRKAALQHLRMNRSDLFQSNDPSTYSYGALIAPALSLLTELPRIAGYYNYAVARGWCNKLDLNMDPADDYCEQKPSWVRLNSPDGIKLGGGHRVKQITSSDDWGSVTGNSGDDYTYGQQYIYSLPDGTSSGVAEYEPLTGGDEIPQRLPVKYSNERFLSHDQALYVEEPMGESYFPAANVGYSRVIVSSILPSGVTKSKAGISVTEFYTAKDFPVITKRTELEKEKFPLPLIIPFIGNISINNRGYSQGYSVELNDMHGKVKMTGTAPANADITDPYMKLSRKTVYKYLTESNQLSNTVTVLDNDGVTRTAEIGRTHDFFVDLQQDYNKTQTLGLQTNVDGNIFGIVLPSLVPLIDVSKAMFRSAVTMKVIQRNGIISEVETYADGATSIAKNLMYDAETGAPLLTQVYNNFEKPVYTYNFAGHWYYDHLGGAYKNIGMQSAGTTDASGYLAVTDPSLYYTTGDELEYKQLSGSATGLYWVDQVDDVNNRIRLVDENGTPASSLANGFYLTARSGYRNQQTATSGTIVSLSNPVTGRYFPLFDAVNALSSVAVNTTYSYTDCVTGSQNFRVGYSNGSLIFAAYAGDEPAGCEAQIIFTGTSIPSALADIGGKDLFLLGSTVVEVLDGSGNVVYTGTWSDPGNCFHACLDDVLHADATRFSDDWTFDYDDIDQLQSTTTVAGLSSYNDYRSGKRGIWRSQSNYLYQVDRKQTSTSASKTNIAKDGTYNNFVLYNWKADADKNPQWSFVSEVTRYSPFGGAIETRDALGIYSASLQGYRHSLTTAAAANCGYFELAFDGFEDYSTTYDGHGHINFERTVGEGAISLSASHAHTGTHSLPVTTGDPLKFESTTLTAPASNQKFFTAKPNQDYYFSLWVKPDAAATTMPSVTIVDNSGTTTFNVDLKVAAIEGWRKIEGKIKAGAASSTVSIQLNAGSHTAYFDDIRMQPFKSAMTSTVYDPNTHWVLAELDNRNFATFYLYDEEGAVIQVKQETEKGIITLSTGRSNIKRQ